MENKPITIEGREYILGRIKTGAGRKIKSSKTDPSDFSVAFLAASLKAGGMTEASPEWVDDNIPFFNGAGTSPFSELVAAAYEVNGYKVAVPAKGEPLPEAGPAESTSTNSTVN